MAINKAPNPLSDEQESRVVRKDLLFVIIMNLTFLAIIIGLYFFNRTNGQVDQFFAHLLKF